MEGDHIGVLVEQRHGAITLLRRVEPDVEPHHLDLRLSVHRAHAQREGIDALQHLGDGEARHVAGHAGLAHAARRDAREVAALVVARIGRGHVGCLLVAGDGFELHVGEVLRHLERGLHVAEAGREDDLVARGREVADHALGVRPLGHVLDKGGFHAGAQRGLDGLAALIVLARPARLGDGRYIHKARLHGFGRRLGLGKNGGEKTGGRERGSEVFVHGVPLHGPEDKKTKDRRDSGLCAGFYLLGRTGPLLRDSQASPATAPAACHRPPRTRCRTGSSPPRSARAATASSRPQPGVWKGMPP